MKLSSSSIKICAYLIIVFYRICDRKRKTNIVKRHLSEFINTSFSLHVTVKLVYQCLLCLLAVDVEVNRATKQQVQQVLLSGAERSSDQGIDLLILSALPHGHDNTAAATVWCLCVQFMQFRGDRWVLWVSWENINYCLLVFFLRLTGAVLLRAIESES